jgi:hypothetical protein
VAQQVLKGLRLSQPTDCPDQIYKLMVSCWDSEPNQRPTFLEIVKNLEEMLKELRKPEEMATVARSVEPDQYLEVLPNTYSASYIMSPEGQ